MVGHAWVTALRSVCGLLSFVHMMACQVRLRMAHIAQAALIDFKSMQACAWLIWDHVARAIHRRMLHSCHLLKHRGPKLVMHHL